MYKIQKQKEGWNKMTKIKNISTKKIKKMINENTKARQEILKINTLLDNINKTIDLQKRLQKNEIEIANL